MEDKKQLLNYVAENFPPKTKTLPVEDWGTYVAATAYCLFFLFEAGLMMRRRNIVNPGRFSFLMQEVNDFLLCWLE